MNIATAPIDMRVAWYKKKLAELVCEARQDGVVLPVTEHSQPPLAMGNYVLHCDARIARDFEEPYK
jgi:hypothetical protein